MCGGRFGRRGGFGPGFFFFFWLVGERGDGEEGRREGAITLRINHDTWSLANFWPVCGSNIASRSECFPSINGALIGTP